MATKPDLEFPAHASATVHVRIIDTTTQIEGLSAAPFLAPEIPGLTELSGPCFSFLIEHPSSRSLLFDLGVRKDWENLAPVITKRIEAVKCRVTVQKGVREQLDDHGVDTKNIEAVIWSHWHWDHVGDPSTFEKSTALIVGPGVKENLTPGYPTNPVGRILGSDYEGRELREISFDQGLKIGKFDAFDYFGDGSFYLLDSPGHAIGHMCGLARVKSSPNGFILMGGDICHHVGQFRPSPWHPLPSSISPNPFDSRGITPCPGEIFEHLLRDNDKTKPFYTVAKLDDGIKIVYDADQAEASTGKLQEADALDEVFVVIAHDSSLLSVVDFFPKYADNFKEKGWTDDGKWLFLKDFAHAVGK
jgi:glyoxylase-like metal-dependent hydrolase (beta-lactamase superfamily II)